MARDPLASIGNRAAAAAATSQMVRSRDDQVRNNAGGFVFEVNDESKLTRFLVLGTTGGTYYQGEREFTAEVTKEITQVMNRLGVRFVEILREVSVNGRAPKQKPTLWALALAATARHPDGSVNSEVRSAAYNVVGDICRTGTMLFNFMSYTRNFVGGNGRGFRRAVGNWYNGRDIRNLERQIAKYGQREGFSHRDVLRLAHPAPVDADHAALYKWVTGKSTEASAFIEAAERAKRSTDANEVIRLIADFGLEREMINSALLKDPKVWEALLPNLGITALVRNLGAMTACGLIVPNSAAEKQIAATFADTDKVARSRIHPFNVLVALRLYEQGRGFRGNLTWNGTRRIIDSLDEMFYTAFGNVDGSGGNSLLAIDCSGSMSIQLADSPLSVREAAAAMVMVTARTEEDYEIVGFTSSGSRGWGQMGSSGLTELKISSRQRLDDVIRTINRQDWGSTDCSLPFTWATKNRRSFDNFAVYTDSETYAGSIKPHEALVQYRNKMNKPQARSVVVGMTASRFSIADPRDPGMLDVVGFDTAAPQLISDFFAGRV